MTGRVRSTPFRYVSNEHKSSYVSHTCIKKRVTGRIKGRSRKDKQQAIYQVLFDLEQGQTETGKCQRLLRATKEKI